MQSKELSEYFRRALFLCVVKPLKSRKKELDKLLTRCGGDYNVLRYECGPAFLVLFNKLLLVFDY